MYFNKDHSSLLRNAEKLNLCTTHFQFVFEAPVDLFFFTCRAESNFTLDECACCSNLIGSELGLISLIF